MRTSLPYACRVPVSKWLGAEGLKRLGLLAILACGTAHANTITVDDASSGSVAGHCTIQDAVVAANTNAAVNGCTAGSAGIDTIVFAAGVTSITLAAPMSTPFPGCTPFGLVITEQLTIDGGAVTGSGVPKVTITRSSAAGTPQFGVIDAGCGQPSLFVSLLGLTISNGDNSGTANNFGGGVFGEGLFISDSVISGNTSDYGGGIRAASSLTMVSSTVSNNSAANLSYGGGIAGDGPMSISGSTINGNTASTGGGMYSAPAGSITIDNSTISGNTGSGIDAGSVTAYFVTVTANTGPGINLGTAGSGSAVAELDDTVLAGNGSPPTVNDLETAASRPITGTFNYIGSLSAVALTDLDVGARIASCSPFNLGPLANNGGGTKTQALLAGSCLIDAGGIVSPGGGLFAHDQRGSAFPRFVNTHADIGAFEYQGAPTAIDGACGSDNGKTLLAAPVNLCSAGSASVIAGSGHPWSWTCTGTGGGGNASCAATIKTWTVSASPSGIGGSVAPASQTVDNGATAQVTASAALAYALAGASGCGGSLSGNVYTTAMITGDCAISVTFAAAPPVVAVPYPAPTLSSWALWLLAIGVALVAVCARRRPIG